MEQYLKDKDNTWYEKPEQVVGVFVDPITGELANEKTKKRKIFYYLKGTEPTDLLDLSYLQEFDINFECIVQRFERM